MKTFSRATLIAAPVAVALVLTGCSSGGTESGASGTVQVVASTNVYGDIAKQVGGDDVTVTSLISSAAQDPHSYEASAQDRLALTRADLVIENGGGYDPFVDTLLDAGAKDDVSVINASEVSGLLPGSDGATHEHDSDETATPAAEGGAGGDSAGGDAADAASGAGEDAAGEDAASGSGEASDEAHEGHDHVEGFNEHVWYSFDAMDKVAHEVAHELGEKDSANAATYEKNYEAFAEKLAGLKTKAGELTAEAAGAGVAITEPVPLYLLEEIGFENKTPADFSEAIEEGTDVSPSVLQQTLAIFSEHQVKLLAYNEQTSGPETAEVESAAKDAGIPIVSFTETMPEGEDYVSWMTKNISAISDALAS